MCSLMPKRDSKLPATMSTTAQRRGLPQTRRANPPPRAPKAMMAVTMASQDLSGSVDPITSGRSAPKKLHVLEIRAPVTVSRKTAPPSFVAAIRPR
jgi:hypothetical protein